MMEELRRVEFLGGNVMRNITKSKSHFFYCKQQPKITPDPSEKARLGDQDAIAIGSSDRAIKHLREHFTTTFS